MIPDFNDNGNLPAGIHYCSAQELFGRFGYNAKRAWLLDGLSLLIKNLEAAGCTLIYVDGSFVTEKEFPGDYDMAWSIAGVDPSKLDPCLLLSSDKDRDEIELRYRGDVFPAEIPEGRSGKTFLNFFQEDKNTGEKKGIVAIKIGGKQ
ncbi:MULTISPECIES: DUF6932 family protein [Marinomonas]|uniref:Uncharacterized protein n=1 Tax=Marinomonas pollencensis TaxID=491954 RepID=A0A3E0DBV2_9GAMM|nr:MULTISPECIES: hypothetical protein [Marinomonas]MBM6552358.1 hypothetical protein [Marinomonas ostreistagni]REG79371.1 hypothetical protein DFP81_12032 [Marinomonas pollencensis]